MHLYAGYMRIICGLSKIQQRIQRVAREILQKHKFGYGLNLHPEFPYKFKYFRLYKKREPYLKVRPSFYLLKKNCLLKKQLRS